MDWARGYAERTIRSMIWDFFASLGWPHYAVVVALLLMLLGMAGLVLGAPMKRVGVLGGLSFALFLASFYSWPPPPPEPEPVPLVDVNELKRMADEAARLAAEAARKAAELAEKARPYVEKAVEVSKIVIVEGGKLLLRGADYLLEKGFEKGQSALKRLRSWGISLPGWYRHTEEELAAIRERERIRVEQEKARLALEEKWARQQRVKAREAERLRIIRQKNGEACVIIDNMMAQEMARAMQQQAEFERQRREQIRRLMNGGRP